MKTGIIDTGIANLGSARRALELLDAAPAIISRPEELASCDAIILPGVGSFDVAMGKLDQSGFSQAIREQAKAGKPLLGICLGMQLLASHGSEGGPCDGLGLIAGSVVHLETAGCRERLPHMGWNSVAMVRESPLTRGLGDGTDFYFVHSYAFVPEDAMRICGVCDHGVEFAAIVQQENVFGAQFHPEKSSAAGLALLRNFVATATC